MKLRVARGTNDLERISEMYCEGLTLEVLGSFKNHAGFDGVMLGHKSSTYHFEFTHEHGVKAPASHSAESLLVFYLPNPEEFSQVEKKMTRAGFIRVKAHNPYWDQNGYVFEDLEGYRIVLCRNDWNA